MTVAHGRTRALFIAPLVVLALLVLGGPTASRAGAEPASGAVEVAGTPPGSVEVTTPEVAQKGAVGFCVHNFRVETGGSSVGQQFMVKFDDFGAYGIGPFTPDAAGDLCATVSTDPAAHEGEKGGAKDKIPTDLCSPGKEHWLRFLSGSWAQGGTPRSLTAKFRMTGTCESTSAPTPGGGTTATETTVAAASLKLLDHKLALQGRSVALRIQAGAAGASGRVVLRAAHKVPVAGPGSPRAKAVLARGGYRVAGGKTKTLRINLTVAGRRILADRDRLAARLLLRPAAGEAQSWPVLLAR
ncbi:MAG: hypothetical protein BGO11_02685 [Solirubrobacterales bacterium 70-9]|nr:MAG: hypothetical protein BGO11_02685 [Solirubrobacterales bacterium 70-9]